MFRPVFTSSVALRAAARRSYATEKAVKVPVQLFGLEGSYATALYTAAIKEGSFENVDKAINSIKSTVETDSKVTTVLSDPSLSSDDKKKVVDALAAGSKADKTLTNFFQVLADNNRLPLIGEIINQFDILSKAHYGKVSATVTSAAALDKKILNRLQTAIGGSSFVGKSKTLELVNKVNPDILGGLIVEVGDRTVDLSVSNKIAKLNKVLTDSV